MDKRKNIHDEIACVAFDLFLKRGGAHGYDVEDWMEAQRIVMKRHSKKIQGEAQSIEQAKGTKGRGKTPQNTKIIQKRP